MEKGLREVRVSAGLEISDIARKTGITSKYLKAIEKGDFGALPGDIYTRGYIKEYAKCLSMPFSDALEEYETYLRKKSRDKKNGSGEASAKGGILMKLERFFHHKEESEAGQGHPCR